MTRFQCRFSSYWTVKFICLKRSVMFETISEILEATSFVSGAWYKSYSEQPTEIVNASAGPGKISCALAVWVFLWSIFTIFWHIWPLCPLILWLLPPGRAKFLVQTMASWVFLWPIFATFCHSAVQQKIVSWFENLWKEIRKELKQLFLLMLKFKVSQELDVHLSVLFYVAMSKRLEIQS